MSITHRVHVAALAAIFAVSPLTAHAQAIIKVNDSTSIRFGFLAQMWADFQQNARQDTSFAQSIFFRRMRFIASAQVGSKLSIFFQTDDPNLGRAAPGTNKNLAGATNGQGFIIQDAYIELKPASAPVWVDAGLILIPLCRNCYASAASLLPIDYGAYSFLASTPTGSVAGRDGGVMVKGTFADQHVEYRAGLFTGARATTGGAAPVTTASNSFRGAGHLMVNFMETEAPGYVLPGTYLGRRKVFNVGAGFDVQSVYKAYAADAFLSYPLGANGVTLASTYIHYDGSTFFPTLARENTFEVEGGYHFTDAKITPWVKWETRNIDAAFQTAALQNEHRLQLGGTYYWVGQTLNVKAAYNRYTFKVLNASELSQNGFTVQLQAFYY
ncbi:MAG TPA: hypothetical protein VGG84_08090 [Gemmatimonadaceae bacterium]